MENKLNYEAVAKKIIGEELTESEKQNIDEIKKTHEESKANSFGIDRETLLSKEKSVMA